MTVSVYETCIVCKNSFKTSTNALKCYNCRKKPKLDLSKTPKITTFFKVIKRKDKKKN